MSPTEMSSIFWYYKQAMTWIVWQDNSVETPSMIDPLRNMLYWRSGEISTQSAERLALSGGQSLFTLGLPKFALSPEYSLSLPWDSSISINFLIRVRNITWRKRTKSSKIPCRFQAWMSLWCPLRRSLCKHAVATQWPLKRGWVCSIWRFGSALELSALC